MLKAACSKQWKRDHPDRDAEIQRKTKLKAKFGLTPEQFRQMIADQGGLCRICRKRPATHVDHNHTTGAVRGVLCNNCNRGIGLLGDDPDTALSASEYLRKT